MERHMDLEVIYNLPAIDAGIYELSVMILAYLVSEWALKSREDKQPWLYCEKPCPRLMGRKTRRGRELSFRAGWHA